MNIEIKKNEKIYTSIKEALEYLPASEHAILCKDNYGYIAFIIEVEAQLLNRRFLYCDNNSNNMVVNSYDELSIDYNFSNIIFEIVKKDDIKIVFERGC